MSNHKNTRRLLACAVAALALAGPTTSTGALADPGPATPTNDDEAIQMELAAVGQQEEFSAFVTRA